MPQRIRLRAGSSALALLTGAALLAFGAAAQTAAGATTAVVSLLPSDAAATVADPGQLTGRRVSVPTQVCATDKVTLCGLARHLNQLDGFDLDPRLALRFSGPVNVDDVIRSTWLRPAGGGGSGYGIDRVVYDAATSTVYAHPKHQLAPGTRYQLRVTGGHGFSPSSTTFTTLSATDGLLDLRRQLADGSAFAAAGISPAERGLRVDAVVPVDATTQFSYTQDLGTTGGLVPVSVPAPVAGTVVFGSFLAPTWLRGDRTIRQTPTKDGGPAALRASRLPFVLVLPPGPAPAGGWPTAVYGHGVTRKDADVLIAASVNSRLGLATIATDVVGHGFGPLSSWSYVHDGVAGTVPAHARGVDLDGDGTITYSEGSSTLPTGQAAAVGSRDALRQTVADNMTLIRAILRGADVDGTPGVDLRPNGVTYFGHSFGGIYGTMLVGVDPQVTRSALSVPGGPISEIVRLGSFRLVETEALLVAGLLNSSDPAKSYFEESLPLRGQPAVLSPAPLALPIQSYLADATWLARPGGPETFAPLVPAPRTLVQVAFGDRTVPNPTAYTLLDAGQLFWRTSLYRNDRAAEAQRVLDPHSFLIDGLQFPEALAQGQTQILAFLKDGQTIDPDGPGDIWDVPVVDKAVLLPLNFANPAFP